MICALIGACAFFLGYLVRGLILAAGRNNAEWRHRRQIQQSDSEDLFCRLESMKRFVNDYIGRYSSMAVPKELIEEELVRRISNGRWIAPIKKIEDEES